MLVVGEVVWNADLYNMIATEIQSGGSLHFQNIAGKVIKVSTQSTPLQGVFLRALPANICFGI